VTPARIYDTFMLGPDETALDLLECRLTELEDTPICWFVIVEASVTHRGEDKPLLYLDHAARFARWHDRIRYVFADPLPGGSDPWIREHAQRDWATLGLADAMPGDIILHGDLDEIPAAGAVKDLLGGLAHPVVFSMRHYMFAADWQYPGSPWPGTIAARLGGIGSFAGLRSQRFTLPQVPDAGWHLSWMGGHEAHVRKLATDCHGADDRTAAEDERIRSGRAYRYGVHHSGAQMIPVDVDETWPRWVAERKCPPSWFRPRTAPALDALAGMVAW
jgi:Glycosyltransferase family 17